MNSKLKTRADDEDDFFLGPVKGPLGYTVKTKQLNNFTVHLNEEVKDAAYYSKVFDMFIDAGENDIVNVFVASPGGDLDGLNVLLEGVKLTDAHVCAIIIGSAHSAASIFALNCHEVIVSDSATMLCHGIRTGFGGKLADLDAYTAHTKKTSDKLLQETYEGFLTPVEISSLLQGRELWLDAEAIRERLNNKIEYMQAKQDAEKTQAEKKSTRKKKAPTA